MSMYIYINLRVHYVVYTCAFTITKKLHAVFFPRLIFQIHMFMIQRNILFSMAQQQIRSDIRRQFPLRIEI